MVVKFRAGGVERHGDDYRDIRWGHDWHRRVREDRGRHGRRRQGHRERIPAHRIGARRLDHVQASVLDINGNVLPATPVRSRPPRAHCRRALVTTDSNGVATITLTTSQQATVTASVGATAPRRRRRTGTGGTGDATTHASGQASGSVTVNVIRRADHLDHAARRRRRAPGFLPRSRSPSPVPTGGSAVRDVRIIVGRRRLAEPRRPHRQVRSSRTSIAPTARTPSRRP